MTFPVQTILVAVTMIFFVPAKERRPLFACRLQVIVATGALTASGTIRICRMMRPALRVKSVENEPLVQL